MNKAAFTPDGRRRLGWPSPDRFILSDDTKREHVRIANELHGLAKEEWDAARRVVAQAFAGVIQTAIQKTGWKETNYNCPFHFVAGGRCKKIGICESGQRMIGDHGRFFKHKTGRKIYISQPYDLEHDALVQMASASLDLEVSFRIRATSEHFYGVTPLIMWYVGDIPNWPF